MPYNSSNMATVVILMATYNGEKYIDAQLKSIIAQDYTNWHLLVRDDGSTDGTIDIVKHYQDDPRIQLINTPGIAKGACGNFAALYAWARQNYPDDYLMFSDQDDIWHTNKISHTLHIVRQTESKYPEQPVMAYGALQLVTAQGEPMTAEIKLLEQLTFHQTIAQNYAFGCTMMLNRQLMNLMDEIPVWAENHDYWACMVAVAFGRTVFIPGKLISYRQHGNNVTSQGSGFKLRWQRFTSGFNAQLSTLHKRLIMLDGFQKKYKPLLSGHYAKMLAKYVAAYRKSKLQLMQVISKYKIYKLGPLQNAGFMYTAMALHSKLKKEQGN